MISVPLAPPVPLPHEPALSCRVCGGVLIYLGPWGDRGLCIHVVECESCGWRWWLAPDHWEFRLGYLKEAVPPQRIGKEIVRS